MKTRIFAIFLPALLVLAACSGPDARISANQQLFNTYAPEVQRNIRDGQITLGFNSDQVRMALGEPTQTAVRTTQYGTGETWLYKKSGPTVSIGFGFGFGAVSAPFGIGTGIGVSTPVGKRGDQLRVVFENGLVTQIEKAQ